MRRYRRPLARVLPTADQYVSLSVQRMARSLRGTPSSADLLNTAAFLEELSRNTKALREMTASGAARGRKRQEPRGRYRAIAYHAVLLKRLGQPDLSAVAEYWSVEEATVTEALHDFGRTAEQEVDYWVGIGTSPIGGGYTIREVLEGELQVQTPKLRAEWKSRKTSPKKANSQRS